MFSPWIFLGCSAQYKSSSSYNKTPAASISYTFNVLGVGGGNFIYCQPNEINSLARNFSTVPRCRGVVTRKHFSPPLSLSLPSPPDKINLWRRVKTVALSQFETAPRGLSERERKERKSPEKDVGNFSCTEQIRLAHRGWKDLTLERKKPFSCTIKPQHAEQSNHRWDCKYWQNSRFGDFREQPSSKKILKSRYSLYVLFGQRLKSET